MPIIFAQALMFFPRMFASFSDSDMASTVKTTFSNIFNPWYNLVFALMIIIFTFFYTAITVQTNKIADDLKRSNGFVPGIRPGTDTANFLDDILSRITFPGAIFLALIAVLPAFAHSMFPGMIRSWAMFYGGTSLLILVGVAIDTIQQGEAYLLNRHYDSLMKSGRKR